MSERLIGPGGGTALGQRRRRLRGRTSHIVCFVARFGVALHLPLLPKRAAEPLDDTTKRRQRGHRRGRWPQEACRPARACNIPVSSNGGRPSRQEVRAMLSRVTAFPCSTHARPPPCLWREDSRLSVTRKPLSRVLRLSIAGATATRPSARRGTCHYVESISSGSGKTGLGCNFQEPMRPWRTWYESSRRSRRVN